MKFAASRSTRQARKSADCALVIADIHGWAVTHGVAARRFPVDQFTRLIDLMSGFKQSTSRGMPRLAHQGKLNIARGQGFQRKEPVSRDTSFPPQSHGRSRGTNATLGSNVISIFLDQNTSKYKKTGGSDIVFSSCGPGRHGQ